MKNLGAEVTTNKSKYFFEYKRSKNFYKNQN